jgi:hypothetical protein
MKVAPAGRTALVQAVQTNCHIADARHAADLTLCTYLLQLREFYRWERGLPFGAPLAQAAVGAWIAEREALWDALAPQDYQALPCGGRDAAIDPFDSAAVNAALQGSGLLYGAGLVGPDRAVFFLAEAGGQAWRDGLPVLSAGRELARGLLAPPAVLAGGRDAPHIVLRREAMARWCWEKYESFMLRPRPGSALQALLDAYGLDADFDAALPRWLDDACEVMLLHELGEHRAGQELGAGWDALRLALPSRRGELLARALRDQLADLAVTLPTLLQRQDDASIHFWFANYEGLRQALFPSLPAAYAAWRAGDGGLALAQAVERGHAHFLNVARRAVLQFDATGSAAAAEAVLTADDAVCT